MMRIILMDALGRRLWLFLGLVEFRTCLEWVGDIMHEYFVE
jgi:hypothetical protein